MLVDEFKTINFRPSRIDSSYKIMTYPRRTTIIDDGEPARNIFRIISGQVMLSKLLPDGRRQIFELLGPESYFGFTPYDHYESNAESLTDLTLAVFDPANIHQSHPSYIASQIFLKQQISDLHDHALLLGRKTATERVSSFIWMLTDRSPRHQNMNTEPVCITVPITRTEIADYLGLTLETVSRAFSRLRQKDVISYERHDGPMVVYMRRLKPLTGTF